MKQRSLQIENVPDQISGIWKIGNFWKTFNLFFQLTAFEQFLEYKFQMHLFSASLAFIFLQELFQKEPFYQLS